MKTLAMRLWIRERVEALQIEIAWRLPKWVVRWVIVRAATKDETGNPGEVTALTMMSRFQP